MFKPVIINAKTINGGQTMTLDAYKMNDNLGDCLTVIHKILFSSESIKINNFDSPIDLGEQKNYEQQDFRIKIMADYFRQVTISMLECIVIINPIKLGDLARAELERRAER